uniref:Rho-GAP domain-containing protein n=1 Tax=Rhabditophanes sp. KR3021 TaxID=114890 RepID=A0AC35TH56_9BILA
MNALQQNQLEVQARLEQLQQLDFTNNYNNANYTYSEPSDCLSPAAQKRLLHQHLAGQNNNNNSTYSTHKKSPLIGEPSICSVSSPLLIRCGDQSNSHSYSPAPTSANFASIYTNSPNGRESISGCEYYRGESLNAMRRRYIKEGAAQLTSISDLLTHHRYLFLFNDLLLVSKQKGENSYKLKEKVAIEKIWLSSITSCNNSFLIGYPGSHSISNYVAHFNSEKEKTEWFEVLHQHIERKRNNKSTTISVAVKIEGRQQIIRKEIVNGTSSTEIVAQLVKELDLPVGTNYELGFESHASGITIFNGIETVYCVLMDLASKCGNQLSESQLAHLDVCPLISCRLVLRLASTTRSSTASYLKTQLRKVLSRPESKRLFGKELEGSMPPQPVLTMIDHLMLHGIETEGIFRKSPKMGTVTQLKAQLDSGQVPDFTQYSVHCSASLLKEYIRSIPGNLLLSGNYHLWVEIVAEKNEEKKMNNCRALLKLLPPSHSVLIRSVIRLLRRVSVYPSSKMNVESLAVCIAPGLLWNDADSLGAGQYVPKLAEYLIRNALDLFDDFTEDGPLLPYKLAQSTDSGLSEDSEARGSVSPDSLLLESPFSDSSSHLPESPTNIRHIEQIVTVNSDGIENDRTPIVSRENSQTTKDISPTTAYQWRSHINRHEPATIHSSLSMKSSIASNENGNLSPRNNYENGIRYVNIAPCNSSSSSSIISSPEVQSKTFGAINYVKYQSNEQKLEPKYESKFGSGTSKYHKDVKPSSFIRDVKDMRVSDAVNHKKKESTDSTKTLTGHHYHSSLNGGKDDGYSSSSVSSYSMANQKSFGSRQTQPPTSLNWKSSVNRATFGDSSKLTSNQPKAQLESVKSWKPTATRYNTNSSVSQTSAPMPVELKSITAHKSLRRPSRAAPEIQLSPLEVNWSVTNLRNAFQTNDAKPMAIDTIYVSRDMMSTINS